MLSVNKVDQNSWYKTVLFILVLNISFHSTIASADPHLDSLEHILKMHHKQDTTYLKDLLVLAVYVRSTNIEKSKAYFEEAIALGQKLSATNYLLSALNGAGITHGMLAENAEALAYFKSSLKLALDNENYQQASTSYNSLGIVHKNIGDYPSSLQYYAKALELNETLGDEYGLARCYENMGNLLDDMKEPAKSLEYYNKALEIYERKNDVRKKTIVQDNIGLLYLKAGDYDKAARIFEKGVAYYVENQMQFYAIRGRNNLGYTYYKQKKYDKAQEQLSIGLEEVVKYNINEDKVNILYTLAKIKADESDFSQSLTYARRAKAIADSLQNIPYQSKAQELLSYVYKANGQLDLALSHYKDYKSLEDSLFNINKAQVFQNQQVLLEVKEKDRQLEEQTLSMKFLNEKLVLESRWKWSLGFASFFLLIAGLLYFQKFKINKKTFLQLESQNHLIKEQKEEIETINQQLEDQILLRQEMDDTINYFATSLFGKNTIEEILWDVAKNCISKLGLVDCVIYLLDEERGVLVQKAAYGTKNPVGFEINQTLEIPVGIGIVGAVALSGAPEVISDVSTDPRYLVDDAERLSELAVPLLIQNKVVGVLDSEHPEKNFFKQYHIDALKTIASICSSKMSQAQADQEAEKARQAQLEAEQIKQMDLVKSQFFANISHEFRTPLNLILAPLNGNNYPIPSRDVEMMKRNAKRLLRLVNELLELAKLEIGLLKLETRNINVFRFVADIANSFIPMAETKGINYEIDIPERDFIGSFDPDNLEKIVYNLLSNAFKFTPTNGSVQLKLSVDDDFLQLVVGDTGIGIPEHLKHKIFQRFYQVDASQTRSYEGTGIGLSITKELVDLHQGKIDIQNKPINGCIFTVLLPVHALDDGVLVEDINTSDAWEEAHYAGVHYENTDGIAENRSADQLPLVLIVEDNPDLRHYMKSQLADKFNILQAKNGTEGLELAREKVPDLVITDIMMPEMDGISLTQFLREDDRTSHIPIILLTARHDIETKIKGFETGAEQYLVKPFEIDELVARVQSLLAQSERLRQKFSKQITLNPKEVVLNNRDADFLEKLMGIIEENIRNEAFTVEQLQKEIGMSRMQLHRKLKALTDQSASDFIRTIRLKRAAQLLQEPGIQIAEAAHLSGFNHMSYFSKCFKEQFGVLPSEFNKEN